MFKESHQCAENMNLHCEPSAGRGFERTLEEGGCLARGKQISSLLVDQGRASETIVEPHAFTDLRQNAGRGFLGGLDLCHQEFRERLEPACYDVCNVIGNAPTQAGDAACVC